MKNGRPLSPLQLTALVWAAALAPAAEFFPSLLIGTDGSGLVLSAAAGGLLVLLGAALLRKNAPDGLGDAVMAGFGPRFGPGVLLIYMVWTEYLLAQRLRLFTRRLAASGERDGSQAFFLLLLVLLLLRTAGLSAESFARAAQLFLAVLAVTGAAVLLLSLPNASPARLLPLRLPRLSSPLTAAGILGWVFPAAFLPVKPDGRTGYRRWAVTAVLLLALAQGIILADLGVGLASRLEAPFFGLAKCVGVEGAFQRAESLAAALWIFADLSLCGLLVQAQKAVWPRVCPIKDRRAGVLSAAAAGVTALLLPPAGRDTALFIAGGNLLLGGLVPLAAGGLIRLREAL